MSSWRGTGKSVSGAGWWGSGVPGTTWELDCQGRVFTSQGSCQVEVCERNFQHTLCTVSFFTREGLDATESLKLLYQSLRALSVKSLSHPLVRAIFELKMLEINGICPSIEDIKARYDLDQSAFYAADFVKQSPVEKLYTFTLTEPVMKQFADLSSNLLRRVVDKRFKSLEMLEEIL